MNKKTKRKDTLLIVTFFIAVIAIFSSLITLFCRTGLIESVSADTIEVNYSFSSSNIFLPGVAFDSVSSTTDLIVNGKYLNYTNTSSSRAMVNNYSGFQKYMLRTSISDPTPGSVDGWDWNIVLTYYSNNPEALDAYETSATVHFAANALNRGYTLAFIVNKNNGVSSYQLNTIGIELVDTNSSSSAYPNLDMIQVDFGNYANKPSYILGSQANSTAFYNYFNGGYYNYISYLDSAGWRYNILIPTIYHGWNSYSYFPWSYYQNRTYYLNVDFDNSSQNQIAFDNGKAEGYEQGKAEGETIGYNKGYDVGKADGFVDGVNSTDTYTFSRLLFSVLDVPITTLTSLFDYDILGFNLWTFLTSMLTLGIVIYIIRLFTGG